MSNTSEILVLEANPDSLRLTHARRGPEAIEIHRVGSFLATNRAQDQSALEDQNLVDALCAYVVDHGLGAKDLVCLIGGSAVSCQFFRLPALKGPALRQAVLLKLGQQLHFPIKDAIIAVEPIGSVHGASGELRVAATALRREVAQAACNLAARLDCPLVALSAAPSALGTLARERHGDAVELEAFAHIDERATTLAVFSGGLPCVTCELTIGLGDFSAALQRPIIKGDDIIQLDAATAVELRDRVGIPKPDDHIEPLDVSGDRILPLLQPPIQKLNQQLTQWLTFASTGENGSKIRRLNLVGPGCAMPGLGATLSQRLALDVARPESPAGRVSLIGAAAALKADCFTITAAALGHLGRLPDLILPEVRKARLLRRVRRSTTFAGPIVAAAIFAVAFLFDQLGSKVQSAYGAHQKDLAGVRRIIGENDKWLEQQKQADLLQQRLDCFAHGSPNWEGLFKELSRLLPGELQATRFGTAAGSGGMRMVIDAIVYSGAQGRAFDEVVEHTLLSLERSPFLHGVHLLSSHKRLGDDQAREGGGTLSIQLDLAYPHETDRA